ncbi:hypothetical protein FLA_5749 [Filimonas lacunae]|nr:hypothetical protein FLA_5749 [Filimonas lacunae]
MINDIVYDTASLSLFGFVVCNTSFPKIITIAPGKKIEMRACFMFLKPETYINLGYSFNRVKKEFNINNTSHMTAYWKSRGKYILRTGQRAIQ